TKLDLGHLFWPSVFKPHLPSSHVGAAFRRRFKSAASSFASLHRIPGEHVARTFERRERRRERSPELLGDILRRPAVGAMDGANHARLIEQKNLVVAHAENLAGNPLGAVGGEED